MKKICIISSDPKFLGGVSLYTWNVVNSLKSQKKNEIFWVYGGRKNRVYVKNGINFVEMKYFGAYPINEISLNFKIKKFLEKNFFDIVESHAIWGMWIKNYNKPEGQSITHYYHGSTWHFFKNHMKRNDALKKIGAFLSMALGRVMEKLPWIKADKIICVSKHVKEELESLYGKRKNIGVIGAKADLKNFKPRNKAASKKKLGLDRNKWYGIYVGRGGFWTKGLDRVIGLSEEIYKNDKDFRLLVIGPDKKKVKSLIKHKFIIFISEASRDKLPYYYNSSDVFFNLSRYEGGDPTLSTAEAMASGCLVVCSKDARQDIIKNGKNGLVLSKFNKKELIKIMKIFNNPKIKKKIVQNALKNVEKILG